MKEFYVYEYYMINTGEVFYIGKGKGKRAYTGKRNKFCTDMMNTHDWNIRIVADNLTEEEAFHKEKELIKYYKENTTYRLTNQTSGGDGTSGFKMPRSAILKMSKMSKDKWKDEEYRNIQLWHRQNGIYKSKEFKEKISELTKGEKNGNYGNRWNDEQKESLSKLRKERGLSKGEQNPKATKIMCIETGEIFEYIKLAQEKHNVKHESSFSIALDTKERTCADFHWVRINDESVHFWSNENNRFDYLIECLKVNRYSTPIICRETRRLFKTKKELKEFLNIGNKKVNKILNNNEEFNGYHYEIIS